MKQNNSTELLGHPSIKNILKMATQTPPDPQIGIFSLSPIELNTVCVRQACPCQPRFNGFSLVFYLAIGWIQACLHTPFGCSEKPEIRVDSLFNYNRFLKIIWVFFDVLGSDGVRGSTFNVNSNKMVAPKLRRIILLLFGLITFKFHFGKIQKVIIFMTFGPSGHDHDLQSQLFLTLDPPNQSK